MVLSLAADCNVEFLSYTPMILNCLNHVYHIIISDISLKTRCFGLHFCRRMFRYIFNHFMQCTMEATKLGEITQNKGHFAVQGH